MRKFNKFFSTVTAVMIASSLTLGPMTLRAEDTENKDKQYTKQEVLDALTKVKEENNKKIKEADERIKKADKEINEAKEKLENINKKYCSDLEKIIPAMKDYCSKNKCTEDQNKKMTEAQKEYKDNCEKLVVPASEEKKEKK